MALRVSEITDERQLQAIIQSRKHWMAIIDAIKDYIFVLNEQGLLVKVNKAFARTFGLHPRQIIGKRFSDLFGTDLAADYSFRDLIREGQPRTFEKKIGDDVYQISIFPLNVEGEELAIHVMKNVTELKRLKDQLYHSDKLVSIGLLVSGVAHEINNPLTGTIAYTELLQMRVTDEEILTDLKKIHESAERCKKIVDNLLTFSRQRVPSKSVESINDIIDRAIELRAYWLKSSGIDVIRQYDRASTSVFVDSQQIQQVILNILLNAEQAIASCGRRDGRIMFTTRFDRERRSVTITIEDNGPGIPASALPKIFDPFFTTKPVGFGTGLGLSISHGIITEHEGTIGVDNTKAGGARFTIDLPTGTGSQRTNPLHEKKS